ncbi:MAG: cardiolipin synthase [Deltaproteobacteria bacterium]|nr:cardiolipin synthase [Candidatus Anaeroferrophillus wilburensis]MBN2888061.1 cardiolipin synthase [Deltaproteobacteria bacterium]
MTVTNWTFVHFFEILGYLLAIILIPRILLERRHPGATLAWILAIGLIPYLGVPVYFLIGGKRIKKIISEIERLAVPPQHFSLPAGSLSPPLSRVAGLLEQTGAFSPVGGNRCQLVDDGVEAYESLAVLIRNAESSIEIATFILGHDDVGRKLVAMLAAKARQGVKVRLLLDALGCFFTKGRFVQPLRDAGGQVGVFLPLLQIRTRWSANLRNHRKMVIVDGKRAITGGMNLAKAYLGPTRDRKRWKDVAFFMEGRGVDDLRQVFWHDWLYATGESYDLNLPAHGLGGSHMVGSIVQVVADGPVFPARRPLYSGILAALHQAEKSIWVVSPYFVPDEPLSAALELAARMGREVRLIIPERSNHPLVDLAGNSFLPDLLAAGVQLYRYQAGMTHAKMIVIDGQLAVVGTVNMDIRSFQLNFELAMFLYSQGDVCQVVAAVERIMAASRLVSLEEIQQRGRVREFAEDICRVFSPVL